MGTGASMGTRMNPVPIIDLFAGPGGLGEGFSSLCDSKGRRRFRIALSIEKDPSARQTLRLRAFFRQFPRGEVPEEYYAHLAGRVSETELWESHPDEAASSDAEAWLAELGSSATPDSEIDRRISQGLGTAARWVLIGGPPCQAYSLVGRSRLIGGEGIARYEADPRHGLYRHYLRIIARHRPSVFVMENVKGLLSAKIGKQRTFDRILSDLRDPSRAMPRAAVDTARYRLHALSPGDLDLFGTAEPEDFVVRAERHGIPQARHRVIILGVREDLGGRPGPLPEMKGPSVEDVIGDLPPLRSGLSHGTDSPDAWAEAIRRISRSSWMEDGRIAKDVVRAVRRGLEDLRSRSGRGGDFLPVRPRPRALAEWFCDERLEGITNHSTRGHMEGDLQRYLFSSAFAAAMGRSPLLDDFPRELLPDHGNVADALEGSKFNDRFRVQLRDRPSTTVVSHISKDGHYFIHHDPTQCRSLTVREAARLQTFPDNYHFKGARTDQYRQVGNAVPPLLARRIAEVVSGILP